MRWTWRHLRKASRSRHRLTRAGKQDRPPDGRAEKPVPWRWKVLMLSAYILGLFLVSASCGSPCGISGGSCSSRKVGCGARPEGRFAGSAVEAGLVLTIQALPPLAVPFMPSVFVLPLQTPPSLQGSRRRGSQCMDSSAKENSSALQTYVYEKVPSSTNSVNGYSKQLTTLRTP